MPDGVVWRGDAILFDMDGTVVDSTVAVDRQWRRWAARHGLDAEPLVAVAHGRRTLDTLRDMAPHLASAEEAERFDAEEASDNEGVVEVPGARVLLSSLPAERWALVTSANRALALARMGAIPLPLPRVVVSADDVRRGKPDPEGYLLAARRLEIAASRCLVFEDTPAGVAAGLAAGMAVLGIGRGSPPDLPGAMLVLPDLRSLSAVRGSPGIELRLIDGRTG
ncbi:MAG TPA: HAD-IA family hydrolase [Vicinamibacterales bacterium]|nr:HAD-IA family hydrolase [Vicinamibacterales bacterium]